MEVFEKNEKIGGKLNVLKESGYTFDLGPSILTLPHIFERLFTGSGKRMSDYFSICRLRPHWRNFFEDGVTLDLFPEPEKMASEAASDMVLPLRGFEKDFRSKRGDLDWLILGPVLTRLGVFIPRRE